VASRSNRILSRRQGSARPDDHAGMHRVGRRAEFLYNGDDRGGGRTIPSHDDDTPTAKPCGRQCRHVCHGLPAVRCRETGVPRRTLARTLHRRPCTGHRWSSGFGPGDRGRDAVGCGSCRSDGRWSNTDTKPPLADLPGRRSTCVAAGRAIYGGWRSSTVANCRSYKGARETSLAGYT
jgi:hypothetical protein